MNEVISLAPGLILDVVGPPGAPIQVPVAILPGTVFSSRSRGYQTAPAYLPYRRGSVRVSFVVEPAVAPGNVKIAASLGVFTGNPATDHGMSLMVFSDASVGFVYSKPGSGLYFAVVSTAPIPVGTMVTLTGSWDTDKPVRGADHAILRVEGYSVDTMMAIGGQTPWEAEVFNLVVMAENVTNNPFVESFVGEVGRLQVSNALLV